MRAVVVRRLLALEETGELETVHVRIAAETAGVSLRTVLRWLAVARESGRVEPAPRRGGFALTDELWARLSDVGGNVKALHRWMAEHAEEVLPTLSTGVLPSLTTLYHAVHREQRAGRVLEISRPAHARQDPDRYDRALAQLALPGTVDESGQAPATEQDGTSQTPHTADDSAPLGRGARLYAPGAHVVSTRQLGAVTEALTHTIAARGVVCVYGDTGHGGL